MTSGKDSSKCWKNTGRVVTASVKTILKAQLMSVLVTIGGPLSRALKDLRDLEPENTQIYGASWQQLPHLMMSPSEDRFLFSTEIISKTQTCECVCVCGISLPPSLSVSLSVASEPSVCSGCVSYVATFLCVVNGGIPGAAVIITGSPHLTWDPASSVMDTFSPSLRWEIPCPGPCALEDYHPGLPLAIPFLVGEEFRRTRKCIWDLEASSAQLPPEGGPHSWCVPLTPRSGHGVAVSKAGVGGGVMELRHGGS